MNINNFLNKDNLTTLWDVISDEDIFKYISRDTQSKIAELFTNNVKGFFEIEKTKTKQTCEISLLNDTGLIYGYLTGTFDEKEENYLLTLVNISKRKIAEEEVRKSRSLLYSLIDSQKESIIFSVDTNYNFINFNKAHYDVMKFL